MLSSLSTSGQVTLALDRLRRLTVARALPRLDWQRRFRSSLKVGLTFDTARHRYLEGLYADQAREVVYRKSGQCGISELLLTDALYTCDQLNGNVAYYFPTDRGVGDFAQARLDPAIEASPYLQEIVITAKGRGVRGVDNVGLKRVRNRYLYLRGAKVDSRGGGTRTTKLKSIDADNVILDELDEMSPAVPELARKRLGASELKLFRMASTPTFTGRGIEREYQLSTKHTWHVRCPHCSRRQPLEHTDLITEWDELGRPAAWHKDKSGAPYIACRKCRRPLDRTAAGEWVPEHPDREVHGYHISKLFSAQAELSAVIAALSKLEALDQQQAWNQDLGLPYATSDQTSLTDEILDDCRREYALGPGGSGAFAGIDVGRVLHLVIRDRRNWWLRHADTYRDFDEIKPVLEQHGVLAVVVDSVPETRAARSFQMDYPAGFVMLSEYGDKESERAFRPYRFELDRMMVKSDRTRVIGNVMASFKRAAEGKGGALLPAKADEIPDYYDQLKAPKKVLRRDGKGRERVAYVEDGPDHYTHAEVYVYLAAAWYFGLQDSAQHVVYDPVRITDY